MRERSDSARSAPGERLAPEEASGGTASAGAAAGLGARAEAVDGSGAEAAVKQCCAALYGSEAAWLLLGDSFHPGGLELTGRLAGRLELAPGRLLLDPAAGRGTSAMMIAERFGCEVLGLDYSQANVDAARAEAERRGLVPRVRFERADAERLPLAGEAVDAILCECSFCLFPDARAAAREFFRALRPGGRVGLADVTRPAAGGGKGLGVGDGAGGAAGANGEDPFADLPSWAACLAGAAPVASYADRLAAAGFEVGCIEAHDYALRALVRTIRGRLTATGILVGLKKLAPPEFDFAAARTLARRAEAVIERGEFGYAVLLAQKPGAAEA